MNYDEKLMVNESELFSLIFSVIGFLFCLYFGVYVYLYGLLIFYIGSNQRVQLIKLKI